ncbi:cilia- and flagella-associated protein 70 isoform X1 [Gadus macrocephalus]|uniref:cilia- and flagella-associated protein 70 isoform X1 n=1 Tax=Gadus macrocephalus TaxID=80720 RepID=UPI0028CB7656|nr:cilia- and flagella-associated protein 70 isoform X1 [Gadus macrocephalus]
MEETLNGKISNGAVNITVLRGNNLQGNKHEPLHHFVRVEFNGALVGESDRRQEVDVTEGVVDYDFSCSFRCPDDRHSLDDMAHKPLILTVMEILPKEKKQKEERTAVLGQAVMDLLPLLHGQCNISSLVQLHCAAGSSLETVSLDNLTLLPSLEVAVSVATPLLSEAQRLSSNLLMVTMETAFGVPEVWSLTVSPGTPACCYTAALKLPVTAEKEEILMFSEGQLRAGDEREAPDRPRKWPQVGSLAPGAQVFSRAVATQEELDEEEFGDLTSPEDREFCHVAETTKKRVCWDTVRRCFLDTGGSTRLSERIEKCRLWPLEIMKAPPPVVQGGKVPETEPEQQISFHGVAYVDMGPLLYPGATRVRGTYRVHPFSESDLLAKTKRTVSVLKEQAKAAASQVKLSLSPPAASPKGTPSKGVNGGNKAGKETTKKLSAVAEQTGQSKLPAAETVTEVDPLVLAERQMYADARTYIVVEITVEKPLVPKRPPAELAKKVMELIPPRLPLPRHPAGAGKAVQEFHQEVTSVVGQVLDQYQQLFGAAFQPGVQPMDPSTQDHRRRQLLGELNYSGKYFALKEQMKSSVVKIVREKMLRTEAFSHPEQLQAFLSQLYVYLVDQMHLALNMTEEPPEAAEVVRPVLDVSQLRHFAREAEHNGDFQLAAQYYQERLVGGPTEPSHWLDYGTFYMRTGDHVKAEECFHHAVSLQQTHLPSLVMCGVLAEMGERYDNVETYLEAATGAHPASVVAWTLSGMFHQGQNNDFKAESCFLTAGRLLRAREGRGGPRGGRGKAKEGRGEAPEGTGETREGRESTQGEEPKLEGRDDEEQEEQEEEGELLEEKGTKEREEAKPESVGVEPERERQADAEMPAAACKPTPAYSRTQSAPPRSSIYMETAQFLLQHHALQMAQRALAQELLSSDGGLTHGLTTAYCLAAAKLQMLSADYCSAAATLKGALANTSKEPEAWALLGHCSYLSGDRAKARQCYQRCLEYQRQPEDTHPVFLRLGSIYLQEGKFQNARTIYLQACSSSPSCLTWLGLGIACYRLEILSEAEEALTEANTLNNMNPDVWGYLSLVSLKIGRRLEAEQSYKYAVKLNLQDEPVLREIKELQDQLGFGDPSF